MGKSAYSRPIDRENNPIIMNDRYFTALAHELRRSILFTLRNETQWLAESRVQDSMDRTVQLTHVHLPLLEDLGLIRWDRDANRIARGSNYGELEPLLAFLDA